MNKNQYEALNQKLDLLLEKIDKADERITVLEKNSKVSTPKTSAKQKSSTTTKSSKKTSTKQTSKKSEIPVLTEDQLNNWSYYKACRSSYCYKQQGCKVWRGKVTKPEGFEFDRAKWDKDKAAFEKVNKYVKKADR